MSKNLTRKGLALGALVALGSSVIAGAPAFAADTTLVPSLGTSTSMIAGEAFQLTASLASNIPTSNLPQLRFKVDSASGVALSAVTIANTALDAVNYATSGATATSFGASDTSKVFALSSAHYGTSASYAKISLTTAATSASTWNVSAWLDANNDGLINGSETAATSTVNFVKKADVTSDVTITSPVEGDTLVTASVRFNSINNEQLDNTKVGLKFTKGDDSTLSGSPDQTVAAWSATKGFEAGATASSALVKDTAVKVQAYYNVGGAAYASTDKIGSSKTASVTARKIATITAAVVRSTTAKDTVTGTATALTNSTFEVKATAKDGATTPVVVAGAPVTVKIETNASLSATAGSVVSLTVGGKTYTDATKLPGTATTGDAKIATTTDATGVAKVAISTAGFVDGQTVTATFYAENFTTSVVVTADDATYSAYITNKASGASTTAGGTASLNVAVYDQFGGVPADSYDARAIYNTGAGRTTNATSASSTSAAVVAGKATLNIVDNGTGSAGNNEYNVVVSKRASGGGYTGNDIVADANFEVRIVEAAALVAGKITATGTAMALNSTTKVYEDATVNALNLNATGNSDFRTVSTAPTFTNPYALSGVVSTAATATAAAVGIEGADLKISGAGLQFRYTVSGSNYVFAADSITIPTSASGNYAVAVASNKAGKQTLTLTSGSYSQTVTLVFDAAADSTATSLVVTAPATSVPGRTVEVSALLTDKFGNPVAVSTTSHVSIAYDGPGQVVGSLPTTFGTDGVAKFRVVLASNDSGSGVATFKYSDADSDFTDTTDIVKTATIVIAAAAVVEPTSKIGTANGRIYANVKDGKGSVVTVRIANKWFTKTALNNDYTFSFKNKKGAKVSVKVYVDGDLSASKTITVK